MAMFSIIIPVYNVAPYLRECLDSVLAQSFTDWECICVDDGSTDGSGEILEAYAAKDARFRVFHQANAGVSSARNFALEHVRGAYVTFVDGDDCLESEWFASAAAAIEEHHPDMVRQGYQLLLPAGHCYQEVTAEPCVYEGPKAVLAWGAYELVMRGYLCFCFIKHSLFEGVRFNSSLKVKEDTLLVLHLLPRLTSVVQTSYSGYRYRYRVDSAVNQQHAPEVFSAFIDATLAYWESHKATYRAHGAGALLADALSYSMLLDLIEWVEVYGSQGIYPTIRAYHQRLKQVGVCSFRQLHFHWVMAYYLYLWFRMVWPIRLLKRITRWRQARMRRATLGE